MADNVLLYRVIAILVSFFLYTITAAPQPSDILETEYVTAKLPNATFFIQPFYDGKDSIYLFGGVLSHEVSDLILRYDINTDTIEEVAQMPSFGFRGSLQSIDNDIFYFGAGKEYRDINKYNPETNTSTTVSTISFGSSHHATFKKSNSTIVYYLHRLGMASYNSRLYSCDLSATDVNATTVPLANVDSFIGFTSVVSGNYAYIFGVDTNTTESDEGNQVLRVAMDTLEMEFVSSDAPAYTEVFPAISDGVYGYIFGYTDPPVLFQFNLETHEWVTLEVEFPFGAGMWYRIAPGAAYVEKFDRIYNFGGITVNATDGMQEYLDDIWYIDLSPVPTTSTSMTIATTTGTVTNTPIASSSVPTTSMPIVTTAIVSTSVSVTVTNMPIISSSTNDTPNNTSTQIFSSAFIVSFAIITATLQLLLAL